MEHLRARFATDGFVVVEDVLSADRCLRLREALARHRPAPAAPRPGIAGYDTACDVVAGDPLSAGDADFSALAADPALTSLTDGVLGPGWSGGGSLVMWSAPGGRGQAWHQDCRADGSRLNCNRLFYVNDIAADDGAVVVVPGSQRMGRVAASSAQADLPGQLALTPRAGTLILLSGLCWHRVTPNQSRRERVSINLRAFPAGTPRDWCAIGVYRDAEVDFRTGTVVSGGSVATPRG